MCLTVYALSTFNLTKEGVQEFTKEDLQDFDDEGLAGWVDGTLSRHTVLLRLTNFFPEMMNIDIKNLFDGQLQHKTCGPNLQTATNQQMTAIREWFFHQTQPIAAGFDLVEEAKLRLHSKNHKDHWMKMAHHLVKFLKWMCHKNADLLSLLMEAVPKDIGGALCLPVAAEITRAAGESSKDKGSTSSGKRKMEDKPEPSAKEPKTGSSSLLKAVVLSDDSDSDEEVDLQGKRLPQGMRVEAVVAQSPKIVPAQQHQPIRWDSTFSYLTCTEKQHAEIEALLATRCLSGGMGIVMNTQALSAPTPEIAVRELLWSHVEGEVTDILKRSKGATSFVMFGLLQDASFNITEHLTMGGEHNQTLRLLESYKRQTISQIQNKDNLPNGYEVQMIGGNHTMHAKKRMLQMNEYQDWEGLQTMSLHIWVNLPISFSRYLGWKHNKMFESQLETYPVLALRKARTAWETKLAELTEGGAIPSDVVANGYVGIDNIGIKDYNKQLRDRKEEQVWTDQNNRDWRIAHVGPAFGIAPTKEQYSSRKDLDAYGNWAQRSARVWDSFKRLEAAINRCKTPPHFALLCFTRAAGDFH